MNKEENIIWKCQLFIATYRVSHIEVCKVNLLWWVEGSMIFLNFGAYWVQEVWKFEFHQPVFIIHYFTNNFFLKHQSKAGFKNLMTLKSSVVIFLALEPQQPQWPWQLQQPQWPQWPPQPHFIKQFTRTNGFIIPSTQITNTSPFFTNIQYSFCQTVEASLHYFFLNWLMKLKFPNRPNPLGTIIQKIYWSFYPLELNYFAHFNMRYPVYWVLHLMALEKKCDKNKYVDFQVVYQTTYLIKNELPFKNIKCTLKSTELRFALSIGT